MKQYQSNVNCCNSVALTISKTSCALFLGIGVHGAFKMHNMTSCSLDFCQHYMKECLCRDAQLFSYSLFSMYLQRCMNIWLMSHGLWRNLITTLQYKASSFTVNTAAKGVSDTKALPGSNECWEVNSFITREDIIHSPALNFCKLTLPSLVCKGFFFLWKQVVTCEL